jgi:hypothetical protein
MAIDKSLDKCTNCKCTGYRCQFAEEEEFADDSVSKYLFSKAREPVQKRTQPPAAAASSASIPTLPTPPGTPLASTMATAAPSGSTPSLRKRADVVTPTAACVKSKESSKRKAVSAPRGSNPYKQMRIDDFSPQPPATRKPDAPDNVFGNRPTDKAAMLRQVSGLTTSFQRFTDVCLRQVESDRKRSEQEGALEECKLTYKESKRLYEERMQAYNESLRAYNKSLRAYNESKRDFKESMRILKEKERLCEKANLLTPPHRNGSLPDQHPQART